MTASALLGFWKFPTAPPRLLTASGFHDTLAVYSPTVFRLTFRRWLRVLAVAYPVLTALVVLGAANHYLADVVAGAGLWALADFGVRHLTRSAATAGRGSVAEAPLG